MAKYVSGRQKNLKVGISSYSENLTSIEVIGNVGIATTNATSKLYVVGDGYFTGVVTASDFYVGNSLVGAGGSFSQLNVSGITTLGVTSTTNLTSQQLNVSGVTTVGFITATNIYVSGVSTIGNFRITPVGSGATVGGIGITYYGDGSNLTGTILNTIQNIDNNQIYYPVLSPIISGTISSISVSSDSIVFNPGTNSLGIGSTQPTTRLDVIGDAKVSGALTATNLTVLDTLNVRGAIDLQDNDILRFGTSNDVRVFYDGTANDLEIELESAANQIAITDNGTYKVVIKKDGSVGIGTTNPTSKLYVVGDTYISGILTATDINSASDIRLKTNIKSFENTLEKIVQINGVSFNWIENNAKSGGIIAQDVEKVFPELVNDGDHKTVNYNGLIGVLVESIKELKQEVENLKSRLSET
jgi:hypothetical protein